MQPVGVRVTIREGDELLLLSVEGIREASSGLRVGTIERDSPARQCLRRLQGFREISPSKISRLRLRLGQTFVATSKARIELDGLLKEFHCASTVLRVGFPRMPQTALIRRPGIEAPRWLAHRAVQFGLGDGRGHSKRDGLGNVVLHCENIEEIAIIALGPDMLPSVGLDQLSSHTDAVAGLTQAAFELVPHTQGVPYLLLIPGAALKSKRGTAGEDH